MKKYRIVGYLAEWSRWQAEQIPLERMTHLNYAFAHIDEGRIGVKEPEKLKELAKLKSRNPELRLMISVGGWGAEGFSEAASEGTLRAKFAESCVEFITNHGFDGVDLDWEYPCSSEAGIRSSEDDKHCFTLLAAEIRKRLDEAGKKQGKQYLLTMAAGTMEEHIQSLQIPELLVYMDFVNIMTYDFHNGFSSISGHHANLYCSLYDNGDKMSVDKAVADYLKAGVPGEKLNLGCAFYGRGWDVASSKSNGLYKAVESRCIEYTYRELVKDCIDKQGFSRLWDESAKAPFLWNGRRFISYEDLESLEWKMEFIKWKELGGAMFWEYTQDFEQTLLDTIYKGLME